MEHLKKESLLTVSEVSKIVGISTQAIYKKLSTDLSTYVVLVDNKKKLKESVIHEYFNKNILKQLPTENLTEIQELVTILKQQIEEKDKHIHTLTTEIAIQNEHERKQADKLISLIEQVNELQRNNQFLLSQNNKSNENIINEKKGFLKRLFKIK